MTEGYYWQDKCVVVMVSRAPTADSTAGRRRCSTAAIQSSRPCRAGDAWRAHMPVLAMGTCEPRPVRRCRMGVPSARRWARANAAGVITRPSMGRQGLEQGVYLPIFGPWRAGHGPARTVATRVPRGAGRRCHWPGARPAARMHARSPSFGPPGRPWGHGRLPSRLLHRGRRRAHAYIAATTYVSSVLVVVGLLAPGGLRPPIGFFGGERRPCCWASRGYLARARYRARPAAGRPVSASIAATMPAASPRA
jgi:hypothetical protein